VAIMQTFQSGGFETPSIRIKSIVSDGYGKYSAYDEKGKHGRAPPPVETEFVRERREERREAQRMEEREEEPDLDVVHDEPLRRSREVERFKPRSEESRPREQPQRKEVPSDLVGRRCLFHGGIAVARCQKCKAVLCRECIRGSDRCPRCNAPLDGSTEAPHEGPRRRPQRESREEEPPEEEPGEDEPHKRKGRDAQRQRKKEEEEDLSRL